MKIVIIDKRTFYVLVGNIVTSVNQGPKRV